MVAGNKGDGRSGGDDEEHGEVAVAVADPFTAMKERNSFNADNEDPGLINDTHTAPLLLTPEVEKARPMSIRKLISGSIEKLMSTV